MHSHMYETLNKNYIAVTIEMWTVVPRVAVFVSVVDSTAVQILLFLNPP